MTVPASLCRATLVLVLAGGMAAGVSGCAVFGLAAATFAPPPKIPAQFTLAAEPTLVIVDQASNPGAWSTASQQIAGEITATLKAKTTTPMLEPSLVVSYRGRRPLGAPRQKPAEEARACGAKQLIYVDLTNYSTQTAMQSTAAEGRVDAAVWVVDADQATVRWPSENNQGWAVAASMPLSATADPRAVDAMQRQMNSQIAARVAKLFYVWVDEK